MPRFMAWLTRETHGFYCLTCEVALRLTCDLCGLLSKMCQMFKSDLPNFQVFFVDFQLSPLWS